MSLIQNSDRPILVTGATGFVGLYVIDALVAAGVAPQRIFGMCQTAETAGQIQNPIVQDLVDHAGVDKMVLELKPCAIIHLAAIAMPRHAARDRSLAWKINFEATRILADAALQAESETRFVFAGSSESYGKSFNNSKGPISEEAPLQPGNVYAATKAAADVMLGQMQLDGLSLVRFRAFNHTGAKQTKGYVVPDFADQIVQIEQGKQAPEIHVGNLQAKRDFLDVRDVANAYVSALGLEANELPQSAINVSSGSPCTIQSILEILLSLTDIEISVKVDQDRLRPSEVPLASGNNQKLKTIFGWDQKYTLENTLQSVLDDLRAHS